MRSKAKKKGLITLILFLFIFGGFYLFYWEGSLPVNRENKTSKIFVIRPGDGINAIAQNLRDAELIRSRLVFFIVIKQFGIEKKLQAGDYRLSQAMNAEQIARALTHGTLDLWITLIEGLRKEEIAEIMIKNFNIPEAQFIDEAQEGYLFPDTYLIPRDASSEAVIKIMTDNFNQRVTPELKDKFGKLNLTTQQAVILASIVERESRFPNDRTVVASIFLRRMREGIPLQADATVQYALGYQENEKTWWKKDLTTIDLKINSPYNTYLNQGLPPAPISNPGLNSLEAVASANPNTPYLFYVSDKTGKLHFARNIDEHNANIQKYLK